MSEQTILRPYTVPRNFDQDAWFLYATSSIAYYELCAQRCEEFAHFFNQLLTGNGAHGRPRVDFWVSRYLAHAENIRRGITFIQQAGDYMPMLGFLDSPASDFRGLIENAFGYETREEWGGIFRRLSYACGTGAATLENNEWAGLYWANREQHRHEYELVDRDDSHCGDGAQNIEFAAGYEALVKPAAYPRHATNPAITGRPGERCPRSGVWVPSQGLDGFSLAFCIEGRPMQPAFRILGEEPDTMFPDSGVGSIVTRAEDTTWLFVEPADADTAAAAAPSNYAARCEAGQPCPREGWWSTPAKAGSRRHFLQGEPMPDFTSDWGTVIWQWDERQ